MKTTALFCTAAAVLCVALRSASAQQSIDTPILSSDQNFRDVAGIAPSMGGSGSPDQTSNGGVMRMGTFYRSEALTQLTLGDWTILSGLNIGLDIDLRTPGEITGTPSIMAPNAGADWVPNGASYLNVNIYGSTNPPPTDNVTTPGQALTYMTNTYRGFASDTGEMANFRTVLLALANEEAAALFHCSGGKDRTGWTAMLLQTIAGVPSNTIMQDYLATNQYMAASIAAALSKIPVADQPTMLILLGVQREFLEAGIAEAIHKYGSLYDYLTQGVGLTLADIYVLRAKLVYFATLPGQTGMVGNAAAGAALLNSLQNSPLSGHYTGFNYYLQSAIAAGTLGGVETQAGGQVHADSASFLLRQSQWVDGAIGTNANGRDLDAGKTRLWLAGTGGYFTSEGGAGIATSTERTAGSIIGATYRIDRRTSIFGGVGYNWGGVGSASGSTNMDTGLATFGVRFGLDTLDSGPFVAARAHVGWVDYRSTRMLAGGLGTAQGHTGGGVASTRADLGTVVRWGEFTFTPQAGIRVAHVGLDGCNESGSDLALAVDANRHTATTAVLDLDVALNAQTFDGWTIAPSATAGIEVALDSPGIASSASIYGFTVSQTAAYDSRHLTRLGLAMTAQRDAFTVRAGINGVVGSSSSSGVDARMSLGYRF
jgi:protein-tyrosine phosphatase